MADLAERVSSFRAWGFILIRRVEKDRERLVFNLAFKKAIKIVSN